MAMRESSRTVSRAARCFMAGILPAAVDIPYTPPRRRNNGRRRAPMTRTTIDPKLDLVLEREVDVPRELVWAAWTMPEHIKEWFCPRPWRVTGCRVDLRPGGEFSSTFRGPEGQEFPNNGCFLEVVPMERLVFTDTLLPGYRPAPKP